MRTTLLSWAFCLVIGVFPASAQLVISTGATLTTVGNHTVDVDVSNVAATPFYIVQNITLASSDPGVTVNSAEFTLAATPSFTPDETLPDVSWGTSSTNAISTDGGLLRVNLTVGAGVTNATVTLTGIVIVSGVSAAPFTPAVPTITIAIPANGPPVANADALTVIVGGTGNGNVLTNDTDPETDPLTAALATGATNGTATVAGNGAFTYTHNGSATTSDSFTYTVSDGNGGTDTGTVSVTITNVAPTASPVSVSTAFQTAVGVTMSATDPESQALTYSIVGNPASGTLSVVAGAGVTYTPNAGFSGSDSFTYKANDGLNDSNTATVSVTVAPANIAPVANADAGTVVVGAGTTGNVLTNDTDADSDPLTAVLLAGATNGTATVAANGDYTYTHNGSATTTDSFTYTVSDGNGGTATGTVTITVTNQAPTAVNLSVTTGFQTAAAITLSATDPESQALTYSIVTSPTNGTLSAVVGFGVTYTPNGGFSGSDSFTYKANDGLNDSNTATVSVMVAAANIPPVANADTGTVVVGASTTGNVLTNDTDADSDPLTAALTTNPANGTATVAASGAYAYTHNGSATTTDSFTYTVSDGNGGTAIGTVAITVTNQAPTATDVSTTTATATAVTVTLAATDPEGLPLTYSIVSTPSNGTLSAVTGATVIYTPSGGFSGPDTFTFKANDGLNDSNTATATVDVNAPPVATGDSGTVVVGGTTSGNVLTNDTDPNGDALTATLATNPANGTATLAANGDFTYTHNGSATTSDSFAYTVSDGNGGTAVGSVSITVTNQAPTAVAVSATTGQETAVAVTFSATDPEGLPLTYAIVANPSNGTLSAVSGASVTYTPTAGFSGTDTFTYRASDGLNNSNTATATIVVNGTPVANADAGLVVVGGVTTGNVLTNDTDPDGDALTATLASNPANGTVTLGTDGAYTYTHNGSATTTDSFTYTVSDGNGGTATGTVSITTQNQAPTAVSVSASTGTATAVVVTFSASDPESQALTYSIVTNPSNGTLSAVSGNSVTYTPSASFSGTDTFTYKANDGLNDSNTATASIVVNRPPVANADAGVVVAGGATTGNVLTNDTDADGDALTAVLASNAANGTATVATNGAYTYTHNGSATTTDSFTYTVSDGNGGTATGIVSITVTNQAPTATDVSSTTASATAVTVTLAATDPEGLPLTYSIVSTPSNGTLSAVTGATVIYTPSAGFSGPDTFTFKANDGINDSNTATATVVVNGPPVATGDSGTVVVGGTTSGNVLTNDTDPNSDALTAALATNPANGAATVAANGDYTYTHNGSATTSDSFTYTVSDGNGGTAAGTVSITVTNQAPTAVAVSAATGQETAVAVTFSATDPEGLPLTYAIVANPSNGTLSAVSGASVTYTPGAGFSGTDTFTYRASDGLNNSNTATATIVVNGTPVANADAGLVVVGGVTTGNVLTNDTDPDGDALTATLASNPANGAVTLGTDGAYTYTHNGSATTSDSFTYTVSDGNGGTATGTVSITTQNQAPTAVSVSASTGTATAVVVTFSASDPESQALAYSIVTTPSNGTLSAVSGNSVTYTPSAGFSGTDTFTYKANDGLNDSNTATASVMVNGAPVANADTGTVLFGGSTSGNVLTNDTDPDGDALTATLASNPSSGTATVSSNGAYTYTHNGSAATSDSFTYTANDGNGGTATGTVTIAVQNQAPTALDLSISTTESRSVPIGLSATDPEGSSLTYLVVTTVTNGFLSPVVGNFVTYTPNPGFSGSDTFTYKANDGTTDSNIATVVIVVNGVPIANGDAFSVGVGGSVAGNVLSNDSDPNGDALTVALATNPVNGTATLASDGALTYTHSGSATASDSFTYTVTDVNGGTATGTVTITVLNQAPTASNLSALTPAGASVTVTLSATDSEGLPLVYSIVSTPTNGTLSAVAGTAVTYTPNGGFFGTDTFTYKASDGLNDSNVATVTVVVNGAPAVVSDAFSVILGGTVSGNVLANDTDPNGDALTAAIADGPSNGTVSLESTGLFTYTHDGSATSTDSFTYTASDGNGGTATGTVSITVSNHTPVATELVVTAEANTAVLITLAATDPEEKPLTYSIVIPPASGTLSPVSGATVLYTPNNGFQGTDLFTYAASDGVNTSVPATVAVTVNAPNLPPVVQPDGYAGPEDTILTVPAPGVLSNDSDPNGHAIQAALETSPDHGVVTLLPDGSFTYTPDPNYFGPDAFTYVAADAQSVSTAAMVTLVITPVNDKPTVQNATLEAVAGIPAQVTLVGADVEGSALTFALIVPPQNGDVTMAGNVATYTATSSFRGTDDFFVRASDGTSTSELASVTVTVTGNDAPLAVPDTYTVDEDDVLSVNAAGGVLSNDTDVDGDPLTAVLVVDASHGNISLNPDGGFFYEPDVDFFGQDSFGYQATDGMAPSETAFATITVNPTGSARLQIVLNAPDDAVNPGDIYLNGELVARRAPYLFAGPFQDVQDGPVQVSLAPGGTNIGAAVATLSGTLEEDGTYIAVISGTGSLGYQLHLIDPAREASLTTGVQVAFYHGSPDTPTVDLVALPDNVEVGHDLTFGAFTPYVNNAASTYDFSVRLALGSQLDIFRIGLTTPGAAHLVMLTGLLADSSPSEKTSATYPLTMVGVNGDGTTSGSIVVTAIEPSSDLVPKTFLLRGNYPNPFNPRTNVQFDLPEAAEVEVRVTDLLGREVLAVPLQSMSAGTNLAIPLDATELASGIYIYRVEAHAANEHYVAVGTMTLIK